MLRRNFVQALLTGGALIASSRASAASEGLRPPDDRSRKPPAPPRADARANVCQGDAPWQLLAPLEAGDEIGLGWRMIELTGIDCGAAILTLRSIETGREARVHLCRHDGNPRGVAHSERVDLILMNRGDGNSFTDEPLGRVLNVLAAIIGQNEQRGVVLPETMISHRARLSFYGSRTLL